MTSSRSAWDSVASTKTLTFVRTTATGTWRTAGVLFVGFAVWTLLDRGGLVEVQLSSEWRHRLEAQRIFLGPLLLLPVILSAWGPWRRHLSSPLLPGRSMLVALVLMAVAVLGVLAPVKARHQQERDEWRTVERLLPSALAASRGPEGWAGIPVEALWTGEPRVRRVSHQTFVWVVTLPWHPAGGLGIDAFGQVSPLDAPIPKMPPRRSP